MHRLIPDVGKWNMGHGEEKGLEWARHRLIVREFQGITNKWHKENISSVEERKGPHLEVLN